MAKGCWGLMLRTWMKTWRLSRVRKFLTLPRTRWNLPTKTEMAIPSLTKTYLELITRTRSPVGEDVMENVKDIVSAEVDVSRGELQGSSATSAANNTSDPDGDANHDDHEEAFAQVSQIHRTGKLRLVSKAYLPPKEIRERLAAERRNSTTFWAGEKRRNLFDMVWNARDVFRKQYHPNLPEDVVDLRKFFPEDVPPDLRKSWSSILRNGTTTSTSSMSSSASGSSTSGSLLADNDSTPTDESTKTALSLSSSAATPRSTRNLNAAIEKKGKMLVQKDHTTAQIFEPSLSEFAPDSALGEADGGSTSAAVLAVLARVSGSKRGDGADGSDIGETKTRKATPERTETSADQERDPRSSPSVSPSREHQPLRQNPKIVVNAQAKMFLMYVYLAKFMPSSSWICRIDADAYFVPQNFRKLLRENGGALGDPGKRAHYFGST
ncbi:unnamed protein product, partial [Amoebophrya sp. A25]|eukprot:GSA25T00022343001.1